MKVDKRLVWLERRLKVEKLGLSSPWILVSIHCIDSNKKCNQKDHSRPPLPTSTFNIDGSTNRCVSFIEKILKNNFNFFLSTANTWRPSTATVVDSECFPPAPRPISSPTSDRCRKAADPRSWFVHIWDATTFLLNPSRKLTTLWLRSAHLTLKSPTPSALIKVASTFWVVNHQTLESMEPSIWRRLEAHRSLWVKSGWDAKNLTQHNRHLVFLFLNKRKLVLTSLKSFSLVTRVCTARRTNLFTNKLLFEFEVQNWSNVS